MPDQEYTSDYRSEENPELLQALAASSETYSAPQEVGYGHYSQAQAGSSSAQYGMLQQLQCPYLMNKSNIHNFLQVADTEYPGVAEPEGDNLPMQIATGTTSVPHITGTPGVEEWVDPREYLAYIARPSTYMRHSLTSFGKVSKLNHQVCFNRAV